MHSNFFAVKQVRAADKINKILSAACLALVAYDSTFTHALVSTYAHTHAYEGQRFDFLVRDERGKPIGSHRSSGEGEGEGERERERERS